jgi:hypothetical protein
MKRQTRKTVQYLHMLGGSIIATYIYSPWNDIAWFDILVKAVVLPAIIISGLTLWPVTAKLLSK